MLRSMTAFASAESDVAQGSLSIEIRSVNHRYLELGLRLPEELRSLEPQVRERVASRAFARQGRSRHALQDGRRRRRRRSRSTMR